MHAHATDSHPLAGGTGSPDERAVAAPAASRGRPARNGPTPLAPFVALLLLVLSLVACSTPHSTAVSGSATDASGFRGQLLEPLEAAPDFTLEDQHGRSFTLSDQRGRAVLLFFGYTNCPDVCPRTLANFVDIKSQLGDPARMVDFVLITVDPDRDTAAVLVDYLGRFDSSFIALRGEAANLEAVKASYGIHGEPSAHEPGSEHYLVAHTDRVFLIDPLGQWALLYREDALPRDVVDDLARLIG
ncbi:MAG: SCO family protein [Chloroflexi bacterium]|nr:SCO family protein [Chloroflexota bacterium]